MKRLLLLLGWLTATPALFAAGVELEARLWTPDLAGGARVGNGSAGTAIDLVSDLGFADDETLEGRLIWRPTKRTSLRLSYSTFDFTGNAQLDRTVSFGGTDFQVEALVESTLSLDYGGIGLAWQFLSTADGRTRLGPLVEARGLRGDAGIRTDIQGLVSLSASEELELAFAAAGLVLDVEPSPKVHLQAEWKVAVEADEGDLTDYQASLSYRPLGVLALRVGYRAVEIDFDDGDETYDLELDGPFFGAVLRF